MLEKRELKRLLRAAKKSDIPSLKKQLENMDADACDAAKITAFGAAAGSGKILAVEYLLSVGASIDGTDVYGYSALMRAASENQIDAIRLLLEKGADIDTKNIYGETSRDVAVRQHSKEAVAVFDEFMMMKAEQSALDRAIKSDEQAFDIGF